MFGTSFKAPVLVTASALALAGFAHSASAQVAAGATSEAVVQAQISIDAGSADSLQDIANRAAAALAKQGYRVVEAKRTFLGRLRLLAESADAQRELIISGSTGAVLRDSIVEVYASGDARGEVGATARSAAREGGNVVGALADTLGGAAETGLRTAEGAIERQNDRRASGAGSVNGSARGSAAGGSSGSSNGAASIGSSVSGSAGASVGGSLGSSGGAASIGSSVTGGLGQ